MMKLDDLRIGIIGLGYVGLPLAVEFSKTRTVYGFDINKKRVEDLQKGKDTTLEIESSDLKGNTDLFFTDDINTLVDCNCYIVTVPTPVTSVNQPDLKPLNMANKSIAKILSKNDIVIYESTVFPGATEEICIPDLENTSGLEFNKDFFVGYSPERINPGDKSHRLKDIIKVTSGSSYQVAKIVDDLYKTIVTAGTFKASSIMVAEAAKIIENTQRDINIALINELAMIFNRLGIDTEEVLLAAGTKWNFLKFWPGLVGGHCIGVDPYYLTYKAKAEGYDPKIILAGREINDGMGLYVAQNLIKEMCKKTIDISEAKILIMGFSFKENCPDTRNTKVYDIYKEITDYSIKVDVYDPWVSAAEVKLIYGIDIINNLKLNQYDAVIVAVGHDEFRLLDYTGIVKFLKDNHIVYDLKYILSKNEKIIRI